MYIRFTLDPFVPHGVNKVIRRTIKDLKTIFPEVVHSVETDESLVKFSRNNTTNALDILRKRLNLRCKGIVVYILSSAIVRREVEISGLSVRDKCVISLFSLGHKDYEKWAAKTRELILHELGHSFGLVPKNRKDTARSRSGTLHCVNNCVMSEDIFESVWSKTSVGRYRKAVSYCDRCRQYLSHQNA